MSSTSIPKLKADWLNQKLRRGVNISQLSMPFACSLLTSYKWPLVASHMACEDDNVLNLTEMDSEQANCF